MSKLKYDVETIVKTVVAVLQELETEDQPEMETCVPTESVKAYKMLEDYPDMLTAKDIAAILRISLCKAYEILRSKKCPSIALGRNCKRLPKEAFIQYLKDSEYRSLLDGADDCYE